jgi:hypothetical protein
MSDQQTVASAPTERLPDRREWPRDPYKGLNYFSAVDAPLFGQREDEIDEMVALLCNFDTRAVLLHGGTGTGKSSFLRAGLCQHLRRLPVDDGREFFFLSGTLCGESNDPLLIRATDDPVGRVYDVLRKAGESESSAFSGQVRQTLHETLSPDTPHDRFGAIPAILDALTAITAPPQRATFVLLVDQAEEVLTLPRTADAKNRRRAFFALIEQICFRRELDLRVIVTLRTEYYGRFCSFFRIKPTTTLTPRTEVGAGLFDYLLFPLSVPDIAAAIRQPTSDAPRNDGLPPARSVYGFSYQGDLPETIAGDLVKQSGDEASTLPSMQIVCKQLYERVVLRGKRNEITEQDYRRFGRAQGAIDAFMVRSIQDAAAAANLPSLRDADIDKWTLVLFLVVGRAEGGTVQTLIASRQDLLKEAEKLGIAEDAADAMLKQMADPERRLLRVAGGEGGTSAYSLGHDSLGPSVLRRADQASVRAEEEKKRAEEEKKQQDALAAERAANERVLAQQRKEQHIRNARNRLFLVVASAVSVIFLVVALGGLLASRVLPLRQKVDTLTTYAAKDHSTDFRLKLLLGAAALRLSDTPVGQWFVDSDAPRDAIRDILLRSPVFAGTFEAAAWDADGKRVVRLQNNKLIVRDLATGKESQSGLPDEDAAAPTSVGLEGRGDDIKTVAALRIPTAQPIVGSEGSTLTPSPRLDLPDELDTSKGIFISRADIFGTHFRLIAMNFVASAINKMWVVPLSGTNGAPFKLDYPSGKLRDLDWDPIRRSALRQPVLAEDCDAYAFVGRNELAKEKGQPPAEDFKIWIGQFAAEKADFVPIKGLLNAGSVAIARDCHSVVVREDSSKIHIVSLDNDFKISRAKDGNPDVISVSLEAISQEMRGVLMPTFGQAQPMLAATPIKDGTGWRVAWPTADGLTVVDVEKSGEQLAATLLRKEQMLTGIEASYAVGSLGLSPDASFAFLSTQQNFAARVQLRAFDLNLDRQREKLKALANDNKLIEEACRVAKLQTGFNFLTHTELEIWLGSRDASQPCTGKE